MGYYLKMSNSEEHLSLLGLREGGGVRGGISPRAAIIKYHQSADLK